MAAHRRGQRLQVMVTALELRKLDDWRFIQRAPSRAAAVRALLKLGLASEGIDSPHLTECRGTYAKVRKTSAP